MAASRDAAELDVSYTNLGSGIWNWPPFRKLERSPDDIVGRCAKLLYLALYTTPEAKQQVPGLFVGSVTTIAEAAGFPVDATRTYLDRLLEDDLVEYDVENRVLRLVALPDSQEFPTNGNGIRGWWRRFSNVPECPTRDAHVHTLAWILYEWCRVTGKNLSKTHQDAWAETFARLHVPTTRPRPRPKKHLQTDLFALQSGASPERSLNELRAEDAERGPDQRDSARSNDFNMNSYNDRSTTVKREKDPEKDQDQVPDQVPDLRSPEVGSWGKQHPVLTLVPMAAFDADDLAEVLATTGMFPRALTREQRLALGRAIGHLDNVGSGQGVLAILREYIASGAPGLELPDPTRLLAQDRVDRRGISLEMVCSPGWLERTIRLATDWKAKANDALASFAEARRKLGYE